MDSEPKPEALKAKTCTELEIYWDGFSSLYQKIIEASTAYGLLSLYNMTKCTEADSILETAVGPGFLLPQVIKMKKPSSLLCLSDISEKMLEICRVRLADLGNSVNLSTEDFLSANNIQLSKQNNEKLNFEDNHFSIYVSNLSLHLVNNPENMLKEALRVLKPGGRAGMSVWGRPENSRIFTIIPEVLKRYNIEMPKERSSFYLQDRNKLIDMMKSAGFKNVIGWYSFCPYNFYSRNDVEEMILSPTFKPLFEIIPSEKRESFVTECFELLEKELKEKHQPIGLEMHFVLGEK